MTAPPTQSLPEWFKRVDGGPHPTVEGLRAYNLPIGFDKVDIYALMQHASDCGASDIKFQSTDYVFIYFKRQWINVTPRRWLEHNEVEKIIHLLYGPQALSQLGQLGELDIAPEFNRFTQDGEPKKIIRFRFNAVRSRVGSTPNGISVTIRTIPDGVPALADMKLPKALENDLLMLAGTTLMVGATGSGKTTLIAAIIGELANGASETALNILTYEQPIEFAYAVEGKGTAPLISQVEIGNHLPSFKRAGPTAMRRKGDLLVIGETRDADGAESFMELSVSGHSVFTTMHATTPHEAIFRIIGMFPEAIRSEAATKLLTALHVICAQKLIRLRSGGVVAVRSWFTFTDAVKRRLSSSKHPYDTWADLVREETHSLGQSFQAQLLPLVASGDITVQQYRSATGASDDEAKALFKEYGHGND